MAGQQNADGNDSKISIRNYREMHILLKTTRQNMEAASKMFSILPSWAECKKPSSWIISSALIPATL